MTLWADQLGETLCTRHAGRRLQNAERRAPNADKHVTGARVWRRAADGSHCAVCAIERSWGADA